MAPAIATEARPCPICGNLIRKRGELCGSRCRRISQSARAGRYDDLDSQPATSLERELRANAVAWVQGCPQPPSTPLRPPEPNYHSCGLGCLVARSRTKPGASRGGALRAT